MDLNISIILVVAMALLFTYTDYKKLYKISLIAKSSATLLIIHLSYICFINNVAQVKPYFEFIFIGLVFGLLGDFFLALKKIYKHKEIMFLIGLIAFLIGHVFYIIAFDLINPINIFDFIFASIYLLVAYCVYKKSNLNFGKLKYGVILYASIISFMMGKATSVLLFASGSIVSYIVFMGALLFVLSDSVLAFSVFSKNKNKKLSLYCHLLYFPAQIILALSILAI